MEGPLWIDRHRPGIDDLPQPEVRDRIERAVGESLNVVVHGPSGSGKTAAVRAMARATHANPDADLVEINVADFFDRTKTEITNDPRFEPFLAGRSGMAKRDMINHVLKEAASYAPADGEFRTVVLDNAEAIREDFQQALRRVMEQYHRTAQFAIITRQPTKLIAPIRSRSFPVPVRAPTEDEIAAVVTDIADAEGAEYEPDGVEFVAGWASGDLRKAILTAQTVHEEAGEITMETAYGVIDDLRSDERIEDALDAAEAGEFTDARSTLDELLIDEGMSGETVLEEILTTARSRYDGERLARLHRLAGEIDADLAEGTNDRIHLGRLLAELGRAA
ncbi:replication factor C small subunit 2 [Halobacteriales archaeon SW_7_68_16]|nr:MAG: replication factor C small subunit 2 [Halobacteriales archaeon SW_7_68_16]